VQASIGVKVQW